MEASISTEIKRRSRELEEHKANIFERLFCCICLRNRRRTALSCSHDEMEKLREQTDLTKGEINHLYKRFCIIGKQSKVFPPIYLRKTDFITLGRMSSNPIVSLLLTDLFGDKKRLSFVAFANYISTFKANTLKTKRETIERSKLKKMQLLFNMYDFDRDGIITQSDLLYIIHKLYGDIMSTEIVLNVVQTILSEMDPSHGGHILFSNFCDSLNVFDMEEMLVIKIPEQ